MRPGSGHLIVGALLLTAGGAVSVLSTEVVWYGAIVVGVIEIARGLYYLLRSGPRSTRPDESSDRARP
jgi:hypothetical protein